MTEELNVETLFVDSVDSVIRTVSLVIKSVITILVSTSNPPKGRLSIIIVKNFGKLLNWGWVGAGAGGITFH